MDIIEQKITEFKGKTFSNNESVLDWLREALKETIEATIDKMSVEEGIQWMQEGNRKDKKGYTVGFNQCCALQREKAKALTNK